MRDADMVALRNLDPRDLPAVLRLNNGAVPAVNRLDPAALEDLLGQAELGLAVAGDGAVDGFMLAFGPGTAYRSPNYRWFAERLRDFLYVDRIVVAPDRRGSGVGRHLYKAAFAAAQERTLCCEVNLRPLNEASLVFHRRLGFREVGQVELEDGKLVAMLSTKPLAPASCDT